MKLASPMFKYVIEINDGEVFSLVLENKKLLRSYLEDLYAQANGENGTIVLSENNEPVSIRKNAEIMDSFVPFDINTKHMLTCISSVLEKKSADEEFFMKTSELLTDIENYIGDLCFELPFKPECKKLSASSLIKAAQVCISYDYNSVIEAVVDYMSIICDFDKTNLFILVNFGSYFSDSEINMFVKTVKLKQMRVLLIDSCEYKSVSGINRLIIDEDLCEI